MTVAFLVSAAANAAPHLFVSMSPAEQLKLTPVLIFGVLEFCLATAFVALWWAAPDYRVFRNMGFFLGIVGVEQFWQYHGGDSSTWALRALAVPVLIETAAEAMQVRNRRWTWLFWPAYLFAFVGGWYPSLAFVHDWPILFSEAALAVLIVMGFRRGNTRDRLIALAFTCHFLARITLSINFRKITGFKSYVTIGGWQWQFTAMTLTLIGFVTLAILVRDLIRDRQEKQRLAMEVEAARAVQQVLIPEDLAEIPGFKIQSFYKPFGEVGGDFFQIIPNLGGSVLIAIGDVSGKGMPAAMTVSLLIGTFRTLASYTQSPSEILAAMNRRMIGRGDGGFTTCLILRADADGTLTLANAGHIAPYCDGRELMPENGLPLGLAADSGYPELRFQLYGDSQLTLMTDGVVEARGKSGELFGFERTREVSGQSVQQIAGAAQSFGQDDDITVLTLSRAPVTVACR